MADTIVGIDFSINSTGICIKEDGVYKYFGLIRENYKLNKKQKIIIQKYDILRDNILIKQTKIKDIFKTYTEREIINIIDAEYLSDEIINCIENNVNLLNNIYVGIEGMSFGSKGSHLSEISGYQYLIRSKIIKKFKNLYVYSPKTIKLIAGKGNFNKEDIKSAFLNSYSNENNLNCFLEASSTKTFMHPFEDFCDAYFIIKTLEKYANL